MPASNSSADHAAAAAPLDRAAEIADEVLRLFLDLDVAVADAPGRRRRRAARISGTDSRSCAGSGSPARCSGRSRRGCARSAASAGGSHHQLADRLALPRFELEHQREAAVWDEREGVGRIDRLRRQDAGRSARGNDCRAIPPRLVERLVADDVHVRRRRAPPQLRPHLLLALRQPVGFAAIAASCWAGVMPSVESSSTPSSLVGLQPGDPHHEEFVEIVAPRSTGSGAARAKDDWGCRLPRGRAG